MEEIRCPKTGRLIWSGGESRLSSDFEEIGILGAGSFGGVVLARNHLDQQEYAIKKIKLSDVDGFAERINEAIFMSKLSHPNIVKYCTTWLEPKMVGKMPVCNEEGSIIDEEEGVTEKQGVVDEEEGVTEKQPILCIQMQRCFGCLKDLMGKQLTDEKIWTFFRQMVIGVDYMHCKSIRHGDLSPSNLFTDEAHENIIIGDFGLASYATHDNAILGDQERALTYYCAPEMKRQNAFYTLRSDVYSLGVILLELFGRYDQEADKSKRARELMAFTEDGKWPEWMTEDGATVYIRQLISEMTESDPQYRYSTGEILSLEPWDV